MSDISTKALSGITAYELHDKLNLQAPPYNPFEIASRLGIKINQDLDFDNIELAGSITNKNGEITIWINPLDPDTRQRFTLAHELGHYVNDILVDGKLEVKDTPDTLYRNGESGSCEIRANNFAGMLLMPKEKILDHTSALIERSPNKTVSVKNLVEELAQIFEVSKPAMIVRLKKLGVIDQGYYI